MTDILKKMKETKTPVALYYKSSGSFYAGFVRETDGEFALLELISPCGKFDGYFVSVSKKYSNWTRERGISKILLRSIVIVPKKFRP